MDEKGKINFGLYSNLSPVRIQIIHMDNNITLLLWEIKLAIYASSHVHHMQMIVLHYSSIHFFTCSLSLLFDLLTIIWHRWFWSVQIPSTLNCPFRGSDTEKVILWYDFNGSIFIGIESSISVIRLLGRLQHKNKSIK